MNILDELMSDDKSAEWYIKGRDHGIHAERMRIKALIEKEQTKLNELDKMHPYNESISSAWSALQGLKNDIDAEEK